MAVLRYDVIKIYKTRHAGIPDLLHCEILPFFIIGFILSSLSDNFPSRNSNNTAMRFVINLTKQIVDFAPFSTEVSIADVQNWRARNR